MRIPAHIYGVLGLTLLSARVAAQAAEGKFYDPSNVASPNGNTVGYEIFRTIGCPGKQLLEAGCPDQDSDGDGVLDSKDKCPNTPKGRKVNAEGCEYDSDGDGVVDALDKCPGTPKGVKVNADGCEPDADGDGIPDSRDKCPTVPAPGTADGCPPQTPAAAVAPKKLVLEGVNFEYNQATLLPEAMAILDMAAVTLKEWGDVKVEVAGHTDSMGSDDFNLKLSQRRAEAVRDYLVSKGIAADRLIEKGYGESNPVADNDTEEGRYKNRRVELIPQK